MALRWVVIVKGPPHGDAVAMLRESVDGELEEWTIEGEGTYYVHSKHKCVLDAWTEAKVLMQIGWASVQVQPTT